MWNILGSRETIVSGPAVAVSSQSNKGVQWLDDQRREFSAEDTFGWALALSSLGLTWIFCALKGKPDNVN